MSEICKLVVFQEEIFKNNNSELEAENCLLRGQIVSLYNQIITLKKSLHGVNEKNTRSEQTILNLQEANKNLQMYIGRLEQNFKNYGKTIGYCF